jgi:imidazolonepropionase-like amidohydrolase
VAPGKRADLLVLNADPTADIGNIRDLGMVILNGEVAVDKRRPGL